MLKVTVEGLSGACRQGSNVMVNRNANPAVDSTTGSSAGSMS